MRINLLLPLAVFALLPLFFACDSTKKSNSKTQITTTFDEEENGKTIKIPIGSTLKAQFSECIGCADVWNIVSYDNNSLTFGAKTNIKQDRPEGMVGGNQQVVFDFVAKKKGTSTLVFDYFEQKVAVTIVVE